MSFQLIARLSFFLRAFAPLRESVLLAARSSSFHCTSRVVLHGSVISLIWLSGCWRGDANQVVVYTALDADFSKPIFADFTAETGIVVAPKFDTESTKTVGLTEALLAERDRPRCDVFWNNEILNTLRLERQGLLEVYFSPAANDYPDSAKSPRGTWHGFAARARVLIVNTKLLPDAADRPTRVGDLADPRWRGKCAIAKPLFGTTATHAACLFDKLGDAKAKQFFRDIQQNEVQILSGNKQVAVAVASGRLAFGLTDTDDCISQIEAGLPVAIVYPDQGEHELGTLFIPNTLAIIKGSPHPAAARRLVDYLLSLAVEAKLAAGPSAQIPLNPIVATKFQDQTQPRIKTPQEIRAMEVEWSAVADHWGAAATFLRAEFSTAE